MSANRSLIEAHRASGIFFVRDPDGGMALNTHIPDPATAGIYRDLTLGGAQAGLSYYFLDNWLRIIHPIRVSIYARLRAMARVKGTPSPSVSDLAGSITLSEYRVRDYFTKWWFKPQPEDPEWVFFQAAVTIIKRDGDTYQFRSVMLDDILSETDLGILSQRLLQARKDGQQELWLPNPCENGGGPSGTPSKMEGVPAPTPSKLRRVAVVRRRSLPPHTPPTPAHVPMPMPGKASTRRAESADCDGSDYPALDAVACQLAERGVSEPALRILERYPDWGHWAQRWLVWVRHKTGVLNPGAFLFSRIRGACEGNEADRRPPFEFQEAQSRRRKSIARTESILAERPKPAYRQEERREEPPVVLAPLGLDAPWGTFLQVCRDLRVPALALTDATPVSLEAGVLTIRVAGKTQVLSLNGRRERLLAAAAELAADFTDLHFVTEKEAARG